jgi:hypothetical protein
MAEFKYKRRQEMEPRPGHKYATVYIKQTDLGTRKTTQLVGAGGRTHFGCL